MTIEQKTHDDVTIISVRGSIMSEPDALQFRKKIYGLLENDVRKVVVDIGSVERMSSTGLGAIMAAMASVKTRGGELCIANASKKTGPLFMVTKLVRVLKLYESVEKAVLSFK
ncbi:MAG TPA: STAS domain-containing protein [Bacteroidota bacterium]